eukprot:848003-Pelagomonas_calceolata.AAC.5
MPCTRIGAVPAPHALHAQAQLGKKGKGYVAVPANKSGSGKAKGASTAWPPQSCLGFDYV